MHMQFGRVKRMMLLAAVFAGSFAVSVALGQSSQKPAGQAKALSAAPTIAASTVPSSHDRSTRQSMLASMHSRSARLTYEAVAGIDNLKVQETASGVLLRFSYRVVDANKAKAINDKRATPYLFDLKTELCCKSHRCQRSGCCVKRRTRLMAPNTGWLFRTRVS